MRRLVAPCPVCLLPIACDDPVDAPADAVADAVALEVVPAADTLNVIGDARE